MKARTTLLLLSVLLVGCSTAWQRSGINTAQLVEDTHQCREAARGGRLEVQKSVSGLSTLLLPVSEMDDRIFAACMRQRGYERGSVD
jgi:hypothetical protein